MILPPQEGELPKGVHGGMVVLPQPKAGESVVVHYVGWFTDGKVFDISYGKPRPATYQLQPEKLIAGWIEALQLMKQGGVYRFLIPPGLAYGEKGKDAIPPNATLVFQIELLKAGS